MELKTYLKNKENELKYMNISDEKYINMGNNCLKENDYEMAISCYNAGKILSNNIIFDFYIGKVYFELQNYEYAKLFLKKYEKVGAIKLDECKYYLFLIAIINNDKILATSLFEEINKICIIEKKKFDLNLFSKSINEKIPNADLKDIYGIKF